MGTLQGWLSGTADDGRFARDVLALAGGTLVAQLPIVTAAPVQTRTIKLPQLALYQTPRAYLHGALLHLPAFLLLTLAWPPIAGLYWFATRLLRMLLVTMIVKAVCRVFCGGAVAIHRAGNFTRLPLIRATLLPGLAGMLPMLVLAAKGAGAFRLRGWRRLAGAYARWLAISFWFDLMAAPAGMLVSIYAAPRTFFCADILAALTGAAALTLAAGLYVAVMTGGDAYRHWLHAEGVR